MRSGHIAITGASSGLGKALALSYAGECERLSLAGRDADRLSVVAGECGQKGCATDREVFDVRDRESLANWLERIDAESPLDLVIANAGVSCANGEDKMEGLADSVRIMEVDAVATLTTARIAAELMAKRGRGAIAVVGSLAALLPLPASPAYCAAKSAARMYALSLRSWLWSRGVRVTVISPGYVSTPMSARVQGRKPFLWSAEKAARHIKRKLAFSPPEIAFPLPLALGIRALTLLPMRWRAFFLRHFDFSVRPDSESSSDAVGRSR